MANPCVVTFRGKEYTYEEWVEYLALDGGLDQLISEGLIKDIGRIPSPKQRVEVKTREDVEKALIGFGMDERQAKDNALLMESAATAMERRYGISRDAYMDMVLTNFEKKEDTGLEQMTLPDGREVTVKKVSPEVVNGFYSPIEKNLMEYGKDKIKAKDWLNVVGKGDEAVFTGVRAFLEGKDPNAMVTKQEILDYMKDNRISVVEVVKGAKQKLSQEAMDDVYNNINEQLSRTNQPQEIKDFVEEKLNNWYNNPSDGNYKTLYYDLGEANMNLDDFIEDAESKMDDTRYYQYQLEGEKENYKEVLVTLPKAEPFILSKTKSFDTLDYTKNTYGVNSSEYRSIKNIVQDELLDRGLIYPMIKILFDQYESTPQDFESSHFDEPNILVHLRMNTRTDADGNKVLFIEEVQSDWGQTGKKKGFKDAKKLENLKNQRQIILDKTWNEGVESITPEEQLKFEELEREINNLLKIESQGVSAAPFVMDTNAWTKLGLKVALKEAVAQGVDKIAWTTGEQQNDRYDLSKQVKKIEINQLNDGTFDVTTTDLDGEEHNGLMRNEKELSDYVGKEIADKVINEGKSIFSGDGLKLGGKGMKGFYGSMEEGTKGIVGGVAEKLFGQKVGETKIETASMMNFEVAKNTEDIKRLSKSGNYTFMENGSPISKSRAYELIENGKSVEARFTGKTTQPSIDITPELKAQVQEGLPLFQEARGRFSIENGKDVIGLFNSSNASTFPHELGHKHLQAIIDIASTNEQARKDLETLIDEYLKAGKSKLSAEDLFKQITSTDKNIMDNTQYRAVHEYFTTGFERWLREGDKAGFSDKMVELFERFAEYLKNVYLTIKGTNLEGVKLTPELNKLYSELFGADWPVIKEQENQAKEDIKNSQIAEADKMKPLSVNKLTEFLKSKTDPNDFSDYLKNILSYVKGLRENNDTDQFTINKTLFDTIDKMDVPTFVKENAIKVIEDNADEIKKAASIKGTLREGFKNAMMSDVLTEAEKKKIRQGDAVTYVKVSLNKLNKSAAELIKDLTFDELYEANKEGALVIDFKNDEALSENVSLLANILGKGRNEMKNNPTPERKAELEAKLADLQDRMDVFGTIMGKGLSAMKLLSKVDPKWFLNKLKKEYRKELSVNVKEKVDRLITELKQKVKELDVFNTDLLFENANKEKLLSEYEKKLSAKGKIAPVKSVSIKAESQWKKDEMAAARQAKKSNLDLLKRIIKPSGLNQSENAMSADELIEAIARDTIEIHIQENKKGMGIDRFVEAMQKDLDGYDYDYISLYLKLSEELKGKYGEDAFNTPEEIEAYYSSTDDELTDDRLKIGEANVEEKMGDELKTLRELMKANSEIAKAKVKALSDFAKKKIVESGLWGRYLENESTRLASDIEKKIAESMGVEFDSSQRALLDEFASTLSSNIRSLIDRALLDMFESTLSSNIRSLIDEVIPTEKGKGVATDYISKLRNISDNKEKFQQVYQAAIDKMVKKYGEAPEIKSVLDALIKNKDVYSSNMMKGGVNQVLKDMDVNIQNYILESKTDKRSLTEKILSGIAEDRGDLKEALKSQLMTMEADLLSGAKNAVAKRITNDIDKLFSKSTNKSTLLSKLKGIMVSQYSETVKNKKEIDNKTAEQLLADALNEQMTEKGREMREAINKQIENYIDSRNWSDAEKDKAREFIKDYQNSIFKSLVTAKVGNKVLSDIVIKSGYSRTQKVDGVEKVYPDWKGLVTAAKTYKTGVRRGIVDELTKVVGNSQVAEDVFNHIMEMYDSRVTKETNKYVAREIAKMAAKRNVFATPRRVTSKLNALMRTYNALGGISNDTFRDFFADEFGLNFMTAEQEANLERLLEKMQVMPEGYLKNEAAEAVTAYVEYLKSPGKFVANSVFSNLYGAVLAHPSTSIVNAYGLPATMFWLKTKALFTGDKFLNKVINESMQSGVWKATFKRGIINMPDDYYTHSDLKYRPEETMHEFLPTDLDVAKQLKAGKIGAAFRSMFLNWNAQGFRSTIKKPDASKLTLLKGFARVNEATDALVQNLSGNAAVYDYYYDKLRKEGKSRKEAAEQAYKLVFPKSETELREAVSLEFLSQGIPADDTMVNYRVNEMQRQARDPKVNEMAKKIGEVAAMRNAPNAGLDAGFFENIAWAMEAARKGLMSKSKDNPSARAMIAATKFTVAPFVRTVGHVLDRSLDATGLGFGRGLYRYVKNVLLFKSALESDVNKGKLTKEEAQYIEAYKAMRSVKDAFTGIAILGALMAYAYGSDDDDDGFYGENPDATEYEKKNGFRNCVVINGVKIPLAYLGTLSIPASLIGNAMDQLRKQKKFAPSIRDPKKMLDDTGYAWGEFLINSGKSLTNLSFLNGFRVAVSTDYKLEGKVGNYAATTMLGAFGIPHRVLKDIYQGIDPTIKASDSFGSGIMKAAPYLSILPGIDKARPMYDFRGRELRVGDRPSVAWSSMVDQFAKQPSDAIDDFLYSMRYLSPNINKSAINYSKITGAGQVDNPSAKELYDIYKEVAKRFDLKLREKGRAGLSEMKDAIQEIVIKSKEYSEIKSQFQYEYERAATQAKFNKEVNKIWKGVEEQVMGEYGYSRKAEKESMKEEPDYQTNPMWKN